MANFPDKPIRVSDINKHAQEKTMWLGSKDSSEQEYWQFDGKSFKPIKTFFSGARQKCIDEIIDNAFDHFIESCKCNIGVGEIAVAMNEDGDVIVANSGTGFQIEWLAENNKWSVETALTNIMAGSNVERKTSDTCGTNGVGTTVVIPHCKSFTIDTFDCRCGITYTQCMQEGLTIIHPPTLVDLFSRSVTPENFATFTKEIAEKVSLVELAKRGHTIVKFQLNDALFNDLQGDRKEFMRKMMEVVKGRLALSTLFAKGHASLYKKTITVKFNGVPLNPTWEMLPIRYAQKRLLTASDGTYWSIGIGLNNPPAGKTPKFQQISIFNAAVAKAGGSHIRHLKRLLMNKIKTALSTLQKDKGLKVDNKWFYDRLFMVVIGTINDPPWKGQTKDMMDIPTNKLKEFQLDQSFVDNLWDGIKMQIEKQLSELKLKRIGKSDIKKFKAEKYSEAEKCRTESNKCMLFTPEGDSAENMLRSGLGSCKTLNRRYVGIFNLGGVPLNARKQVEQHLLSEDTKEAGLIPSTTFLENERFLSLIQAVNLNLTMKYETEEEFDTLRYGCIVIAVDQDNDGVGHILGLLLNFFALFWPALIKRGFVKYLRTPLIRVYDIQASNKTGKSVFQNFYYQTAYDQWVERLPVDQKILNGSKWLPDKKVWATFYYKGLASHNKDSGEIADIFDHFNESTVTFTWDESSPALFEAYYGKDTDLRKKLLYEPFEIDPTYYDRLTTGKISCSEHLNVETRSFQRYVLRRKLKNYIDGLVPSQRKMLFISLKRFGKQNSAIRVSDIAAAAVEPTRYHHAETSLEEVTKRMAQSFVGSNVLPYYIGLGDFGSRDHGRSKTGQSRYIYVRLNKKLVKALFNPIDAQLLDYVFEEGMICEPEFYLPILPMAILDNTRTPAAGWKMESTCRDVFEVIKCIKIMLKGVTPYDLLGLPHKTDLMVAYGSDNYRETCMGEYEYDPEKKEVTVTELPLQVWNGKYKAMLKSQEFVKSSIIDNCDDDKVEFKFKIDPELCAEQMQDSDVFADMIGVRKTIKQHLNMTDEHGNIKVFENFRDVLQDWFIVRRKYYSRRIKRQKLLAKLKLMVAQNVLKFLESNIEFRGMADEDADKLLKDKGIIPINKALISSPGNMSNGLLKKLVIEQGTYAYIYNQSYGKGLKNKQNGIRNKIAALEKEIATYSTTNPDNVWIAELEKVSEIITHGMNTNWSYGKNLRFD